jgi:hypothetical protein
MQRSVIFASRQSGSCLSMAARRCAGAAHSTFITGQTIPTSKLLNLLVGSWIQRCGAG